MLLAGACAILVLLVLVRRTGYRLVLQRRE
jgi:hypothetical protein